MPPRTDIVAVIPAYDAAATIGDVVAGVRRHVARVVVVSDGSRDDTARFARAAGADVDELPANHGKGFALRRGLERALAGATQAVALLDADAQHDPEDLPVLIAAWDAARPAMVIGSRLADAAGIPGVRFWTNYIGSRILSWMTGRELLDSQSGYRLMDASLAARLGLTAVGFSIESEMLIKAARLGARIEHVKIRTIYNDQGSHFRPVLDTVRISCASIYYKIFDDAG